MFKNCCGCKTNVDKNKIGEKESDVYKPDEAKDNVTKDGNKIDKGFDKTMIPIVQVSSESPLSAISEKSARSESKEEQPSPVTDSPVPESKSEREEALTVTEDVTPGKSPSKSAEKASVKIDDKVTDIDEALAKNQVPRKSVSSIKSPEPIIKNVPRAKSPEVTATLPDSSLLTGIRAKSPDTAKVEAKSRKSSETVAAKSPDVTQKSPNPTDGKGKSKEGGAKAEDVAKRLEQVAAEQQIEPKSPNEEDDTSPPAPDVDPNLRVLAQGVLCTPHPAKRSGSIAGIGNLPQWLSQEDDDVFTEAGGATEPPATPVGRDELALRRHRFFSDLLHTHQASSQHRVHFDPLGPTVATCQYACCEPVDLRTPTAELEALVTRLEKVTTRLETVLKPTEANEMSVAAYTDIVQGSLASYLALSGKIGGDVASHANLVNQAFQAQLQFLKIASDSKSPSQSEIVQLLQPTSTQIQAIQEFREKNRGSPFFNHLSAVSESIAALGWVTVAPTPAPYVKEMNDAGQFYTNRVLKDWKEKDKNHVDWVKSWVTLITELQQFVKQHHTTGLVWGGKGTAGPPPPPPGLPPPPPMLPVGDIAPVAHDPSAPDRSALFAEINKGEGITSTLKRVTPDMQTHKNTALRSGPAPFKAPSQTTARSVAAPVAADKPPTFGKEGKKWLVEYQKGNHSLVIDNVEMNNVVYMFKCQDSTLTIKGKLNSVVMDSCKKSSVVFDSLVSSVEFVNCQSVQMQVLGKVPTITIDKTDGCQMYLNPESLDVEIVSSKSSEMNVMVPKANGDYAEYPVPEQYKTTISTNGLLTVAVENKG